MSSIIIFCTSKNGINFFPEGNFAAIVGEDKVAFIVELQAAFDAAGWLLIILDVRAGSIIVDVAGTPEAIVETQAEIEEETYVELPSYGRINYQRNGMI